MIERTWRERAGLAGWTWHLLVHVEISNQWVWEQVSRLQSLTAGFGHTSGAALDTLSGENERKYKIPDEVDSFRDMLLSCPDFYTVTLEMDLECMTPAGQSFTIPNGASLTLFVDRTSDGRIDQNQTPSLQFTLNTDIYDPDSSGGNNEAAAAVNNPRLVEFLHKVEAAGAAFFEVDGPYCPGVHRYGFGEPDAVKP